MDQNGRQFEFTVHINAGDDLKSKALPIIQEQLLEIGIKTTAKVFDASDLGFLYKKEFESFFVDIFSGGDPDSNYRFLHSSQIEKGLNFFRYKNNQIDQLLDRGRSTYDPKERRAIYYAFQEELLQDPPGIFLFWGNRSIAIHKRFRGVNHSAPGLLYNIREWYVPKEEQKYH